MGLLPCMTLISFVSNLQSFFNILFSNAYKYLSLQMLNPNPNFPCYFSH